MSNATTIIPWYNLSSQRSVFCCLVLCIVLLSWSVLRFHVTISSYGPIDRTGPAEALYHQLDASRNDNVSEHLVTVSAEGAGATSLRQTNLRYNSLNSTHSSDDGDISDGTESYPQGLSWLNVTAERRSSVVARKHPHGNVTCPWKNSTWSFPAFPRFIIIGAQKAGTTAIVKLLRKIPNILGSKLDEAHFFDWKFPKNKYFSPNEKCQLLHRYLDKFDFQKISPETIVFEKTPAYMAATEKARSMRALLDPYPPKIVVILRNPVDRYYSWYKMDWQHSGKRNEYPSVETSVKIASKYLRRGSVVRAPPMIDFLSNNGTDFNQSHFAIGPRANGLVEFRRNNIARGFYALQLRDYIEYFPLGSFLKAYRYEYFLMNKQAVMNNLADFVGAPRYNFSEAELSMQMGPLQSLKTDQEYPQMDDMTRAYLKLLYKPFNDKLADLLGEDWRGVWD